MSFKIFNREGKEEVSQFELFQPSQKTLFKIFSSFIEKISSLIFLSLWLNDSLKETSNFNLFFSYKRQVVGRKI